MRQGWVVLGAFWKRGVLAAMVATVGCSDRQLIGEDGFHAFAITEDTPPIFVSEDGDEFFLVEQRIEFPIQTPTDRQMAELEAMATEPFARMPWVVRGDYELEIDYVLINLDDAQREVAVIINGFNEFHEYVPGFAEGEEEAVADFAQFERIVRLEPLERLRGTIREERLDEVTVDLATVVNGVTNANLVMHPENEQTDPRIAPFVPAVVPALTGVRMGLRATGAGNVLIELTIRVRDEAGKIVPIDRMWELPEPELIAPADIAPPEG
ncbi:MAG: hypothetical protein AAGE52_34825 [Myxococcota bacterium]